MTTSSSSGRTRTTGVGGVACGAAGGRLLLDDVRVLGADDGADDDGGELDDFDVEELDGAEDDALVGDASTRGVEVWPCTARSRASSARLWPSWRASDELEGTFGAVVDGDGSPDVGPNSRIPPTMRRIAAIAAMIAIGSQLRSCPSGRGDGEVAAAAARRVVGRRCRRRQPSAVGSRSLRRRSRGTYAMGQVGGQHPGTFAAPGRASGVHRGHRGEQTRPGRRQGRAGCPAIVTSRAATASWTGRRTLGRR